MTRSELATELEKNPQTITKWVAEGAPIAKPGRTGRPHLFRKEDIVAWWKSREEEANSGARLDLTQERARKERALAIIAEMKIAEMEGRLLPREDVAKTWDTHIAAVRTRLLNVPDNLMERVAQAVELDGAWGAHRVLKEAMRQTLRELAKAKPPEESKTPKKRTRRRPTKRKKA